MITAYRLLLTAAPILPAAAVAADSVTMSAGRWEETTTVVSATLDGKPVPPGLLSNADETKFRCISPEEATEPSRFFLQSKPGHSCVPIGTALDGHVEASAVCGGEPPKTVSLSGAYGRQNYDMNARATFGMGGKSLSVALRLRGRFVGACTGNESL